MKRIIFTLLYLFTLVGSIAHASETNVPVKQLRWTFKGALGYYDKAALQRGYQVYNEVCSACHSMNLLTYRKLADIGFGAEEVKAIAATKTVNDGPNDVGEMFERPGRPIDKFINPYPNKEAAIAANGAYPPDLSLIVKSEEHAGGPNFIYSLLTGYEEAPAGFEVIPGKYYNLYYKDHVISMPPPLTADGQVSYTDSTEPTIDNMARDVTNFLQWASEPELEERKKLGLKIGGFLVFCTVVSYILKRRIWRDVK